MNVGMIGLGKLGLPVAVCMAWRGHNVVGYDIDPERMSLAPVRYQEAGPDGIGNFNDYLADSTLRFGSVAEVVAHSEIVFIAVQTPHQPQYEGVTPLPTTRRDFDYEHLEEAVESVVRESVRQEKLTRIAVISTVLPRTIRTKILPIAHGTGCEIFYNPSFIAMTTTMRDFLEPEFALVGADINESGTRFPNAVTSFYDSMGIRTVTVGIEEAELIKVSYNTFIGFKIGFANTLMEICHKINANVDEVTKALGMATRRLISDAYMRGGMGDGGSCHPRDAIAMSWLARDLGLSTDPFEDLMLGRERQSYWLCDLVLDEAAKRGLQPFVLGTAYKRECALEFGSAAVLCKNMMGCESWDPYVDAHIPPPRDPHVFLIGIDHDALLYDFQFPRGSVVIDPWRRIRDYRCEAAGVTLISVGTRSTER